MHKNCHILSGQRKNKWLHLKTWALQTPWQEVGCNYKHHGARLFYFLAEDLTWKMKGLEPTSTVQLSTSPTFLVWELQNLKHILRACSNGLALTFTEYLIGSWKRIVKAGNIFNRILAHHDQTSVNHFTQRGRYIPICPWLLLLIVKVFIMQMAKSKTI